MGWERKHPAAKRGEISGGIKRAQIRQERECAFQ
jgi:hypothetical protein